MVGRQALLLILYQKGRPAVLLAVSCSARIGALFNGRELAGSSIGNLPYRGKHLVGMRGRGQRSPDGEAEKSNRTPRAVREAGARFLLG